MPRIRTARRVGVEMEGYISRYPRNVSITGATIKRDGSLNYGDWTRGGNRYGVEIVTRPIKDMAVVERIFGEMQRNGWHVDERAGTHVHVEITDYTEMDKAKLLRFCKGIERIIFMFVKDYRNDNRYCGNLKDDWRKIFRKNRRWETHRGITTPPNRYSNLLTALTSASYNVDNPKYNWCNIYGSRHKTAEFRLFHAVESAEETVKFVRLAHAIVELCKNSSVEQLEFIIMSLYESKDVTALCQNFFYILGFDKDFTIETKGARAKTYMVQKIAQNRKKRVVEAKKYLAKVEKEPMSPAMIQEMLA